MKQKTILIEGWRQLPHSYSLVAQSLALELNKLNPQSVFFKDAEFFNSHWQKAELFDQKDQEQINSLKNCQTTVDIHFRISFPFNFSESEHKKLLTFVTCEYDNAKENISDQQLKELKQSGQYIVTPSLWSKKGLINTGIPKEKIIVHPHGFFPAYRYRKDFSLHRKRQREIRKSANINFLHIGAMTANKGIDTLLKAFNEIIKRHPNCSLTLKGADSLYKSKEMLHKLFIDCQFSDAEQKDVLSRLKYIGDNLNEREMLKLYHSADIYLSPYRAEGFNMPVLEAQACGLPVICTDGGPTDDFTLDGSSIRVPSKLEKMALGYGLEINFSKFVEVMHTSVKDLELRERAWELAPNLIQSHSWNSIAQQFIDIIEEI